MGQLSEMHRVLRGTQNVSVDNCHFFASKMINPYRAMISFNGMAAATRGLDLT